jgi:hypothetical protein
MKAERIAIAIIAFAVFLLTWRMLAPGYILTLDMAWAPEMPVRWSADGFNNSAPVWALISFLCALVPSWIVQKLFLLSLFFSLFFIPYRFLPLITDWQAKLFAASVYALNPFVYARILAGQWTLLVGYALLPLAMRSLMRMNERRDMRSGLWFGGSLLLLGLFSVHFLYLMLIVSALYLLHALISKSDRLPLIKSSAVGLALFALVSVYWLVPALMRETPLESRFTTPHFEAFAAAPNITIPAALNVLALGGYWGEGTQWNFYFLWPQHTVIFWVAAALLGLLVTLGAWQGWRMRRRETIFFALLGAGAYTLALGAADTPVRALSEFLYAHMPLWSGLRDSHKIAAFLALSYAIFAGLGAQALWKRFASRELASAVLLPAACLLPAVFGLFMWGGMHGQLTPVWYPPEWAEAKELLLESEKKALILPWHGYQSLEFNHQIPVANPASLYFGKNYAVAGKSVEAGILHDQEVSPEYHALDALLATGTPPAPHDLATELAQSNIGFIFIILNSRPQVQDWWTDAYAARAATGITETEFFDGIATDTLIEHELRVVQLAQ